MSEIHRAIEAVWKIESTRLIAAIARVTRDVGTAEELAQDALVAALEQWPKDGLPEKPSAWRGKGRDAAGAEMTENARERELLVGRLEKLPCSDGVSEKFRALFLRSVARDF